MTETEVLARIRALVDEVSDGAPIAAQVRELLAAVLAAPPIPQGWQILNGWIVEPVESAPADYWNGPAVDAEPLFRLSELPGWNQHVQQITDAALDRVVALREENRHRLIEAVIQQVRDEARS